MKPKRRYLVRNSPFLVVTKVTLKSFTVETSPRKTEKKPTGGLNWGISNREGIATAEIKFKTKPNARTNNLQL